MSLPPSLSESSPLRQSCEDVSGEPPGLRGISEPRVASLSQAKVGGPVWGSASPKPELRGCLIGDSGLTTSVQGIPGVRVAMMSQARMAGPLWGRAFRSSELRGMAQAKVASSSPPPPASSSLPHPSLSESSTLRHVRACAFIFSEFVQTVHATVHGTVWHVRACAAMLLRPLQSCTGMCMRLCGRCVHVRPRSGPQNENEH